MSGRKVVVGVLSSALTGSVLGVWFTLNPLSEETIRLLQAAGVGAIIGALGFIALGMFSVFLYAVWLERPQQEDSAKLNGGDSL